MTERRRIWKMVGQGGAQLVIGARSSLYLPFRDLGLIVVDEGRYSTNKKMAHFIMRGICRFCAPLCKASVILASATPSLETWVNAAEIIANHHDGSVWPRCGARYVRN